MAHQGASGQHQVRPGGKQVLVHEEILLLPAQVGMDFPDLGIEEPADRQGGIVHCLQRFLERRLVVQGLAGVGEEDRRDAERVLLDEDRRRRIPGRVATGLEGGPQAAAREGGCVRLLLDQGLAVEGLDHASLLVVFQQGIVLLGRQVVEGLEPVGDVGDAVAQGPGLHPVGHLVRRLHVQRFPVVNAVDQGIVGPDVQIFPHLVPVEDQLSEVIGRPLRRGLYGDGFLLESVLDDIESQFAHVRFILKG